MSMIIKTAPFIPGTFFSKCFEKDFTLITERQDKKSSILKEVDFNTVDFITCLHEGKARIEGWERYMCLKKTGRLLYGASVFMGLWQDYKLNAKKSVLEMLYNKKNITSFDFFGDIFLSPGQDSFVLWLCRCGDDIWRWLYGWMSDRCIINRLSAVG